MYKIKGQTAEHLMIGGLAIVMLAKGAQRIWEALSNCIAGGWWQHGHGWQHGTGWKQNAK